jgi:hypothetical protein
MDKISPCETCEPNINPVCTKECQDVCAMIDTKANLCNTCKNNFATCVSNPTFGDGIGNDNVYQCDAYDGN